MDSNTELLSIRYLINNLIFSNYELNRKLDLLLEKEGKSLQGKPKPRPKTAEKDITFDLFSLSESQYQKLIDKFGVDLTSKCCLALDNFIRNKGFMPYKNGYDSITKIIALNVMKKELDKNKQTKEVVIYNNDIDINTITSASDARKFIKSIPSHLRNIDNRVEILVNKFDLTEYKDEQGLPNGESNQ